MGERALNSPVRRIDVLERVKLRVIAWGDFPLQAGLCPLLCSALHAYGLIEDDMDSTPRMYELRRFFPLYTLDNAVKFGALREEYASNPTFWWPPFIWNSQGGRMRFFNWLIEQYKDDETNLRTI